MVADQTQEELANLVRAALDELPDDVRTMVELQVQPPYTGESPEQVRILGRRHGDLHG